MGSIDRWGWPGWWSGWIHPDEDRISKPERDATRQEKEEQQDATMMGNTRREVEVYMEKSIFSTAPAMHLHLCRLLHALGEDQRLLLLQI